MLAKKLAEKSVSKVTSLVSSWMINLNLISFFVMSDKI